MNFSDKYKGSDYPEMEIEADEADELAEGFSKMEHLFDAATDRRVKDFLRMDWLLREAGIEDKDERYRIIEIIY